MRSLRTFACAFLFLVLPLGSQAQNVKWFEVKSGNFLLFTDTSEAKGRRLLTDLEQRLAAFQVALGTVPKRQFPVEVFLFKLGDDFVASAPAGAGIDSYSSAYFLKGPDRFFVAAQDKSPDDIANDVGHALGHMFFDRTVMWHPFWLEEGVAEYFRRIGRNPENKKLLPDDRFSAGDLLTIVPSATYKDSDPAGPFRIQSYRLLQIVLNEHATEFRSYLRALKTEDGRDAKLAVDGNAVTDRLNQYTETRIPIGTGMPDIQSKEVLASSVSVHRGDLLVAARQTAQAARWYEGNTEEARVARAILGRIVSGKEAAPLMDRAVQDFPNNGLLQFHFGSIESPDEKTVELQVQALERAVPLLPLMGRADAELARVMTLSGRAEGALPLLDRALALEPEYADRFYLLRAQALIALRRLDESAQASRMAAALPHADRATATLYDQQNALVDKAIQDVLSAAEQLQVEQLLATVQDEAARREPPKPPPPPPPTVRVGRIDYQFEATNPVDVLVPVFPDYPDALVRSGKTGKITLQLSVGVDGHVTRAVVSASEIPDMNMDTLTAVGKWTFKPYLRAGQPAAFTIKLIFQYSIQ